jgi:GcrA cell cycle regulator
VEFYVVARHSWTTAELADIAKRLMTSTSAAVAILYKTNPQTLRSALRRHGISVRHARRSQRPQRNCEGLRVQRSALGVTASYGAAALAALPDFACHWPLGDPAESGFAFCGATVEDHGRVYCEEHRARAYTPAED